MSIQAVAWALDQEGIPAGPKLVLVSVANHASHVDGYCWLHANTIAREASCTPRSVYSFVGALIRNGFIRKQLRKGEDGKQRATDYWIVFEREKKDWESGKRPEPSEPDDEAQEDGSSGGGPQDVVAPHEGISDGENEQPDEQNPVDKQSFSYGPSEADFRRKKIEEPSKTNPKKDAREREPYRPRHYAPPPAAPDVQGAVSGDRQAKQIFVFEHSRAWKAWSQYKLATTGRPWQLTSRHLIEGRRGWWFPSLFPPPLPGSTGPPQSLCTEAELEEFGNSG